MEFSAPIKAMQYLLKYAVDFDQITAQDRFADVNDELIGDILGGASVFSRDILSPTNRDGDLNPATLDGQDVKSSPGFKSAYKAFAEAGWQSLSMPTEIGGAGLPSVISVAVNEMIYASNMALGLCPMLTSSAVKAIEAHASEELQEKYMDKMVSGEWTGAMCLTEPQAGSDLGPVRTKAVDNGDGTYTITGQKIYITWGDHDMADNIIHLVLARLPDSPEGSRGISLFVCPKYFVNADGSLGDRNAFAPIGLEHKIGIHGSPTCVMEFTGAKGWLVGEINRGLSCMFTMMNEARLFVGVQGVAIGERAYQAALHFSQERVQGRPIDGDKGDAIIDHPDVRRMLLDMKTRLMGARALAMATACADDLGDHTRAALLTPMTKSYGSDTGVDVTSVGVQIHGGMGFVEETGAGQHYRDSRIAPIYEGTNGIQAIDLVGRKLRRDGGEAMRELIEAIKHINIEAEQAEGLDVCVSALTQGIETLSTATDILLNASEKDALAAATPYQSLCSAVVSGALLIKAAARGKLAGDMGAPNMGVMARYHALSILPDAEGYLEQIRAGADIIFDLPKTALADL